MTVIRTWRSLSPEPPAVLGHRSSGQRRIESWGPDRLFVDAQTRALYALWHHTHEFEPDDGSTIIRDQMRHRFLPGALADWIAGGLVRHDLAAIFHFRTQRIQELLG